MPGHLLPCLFAEVSHGPLPPAYFPPSHSHHKDCTLKVISSAHGFWQAGTPCHSPMGWHTPKLHDMIKITLATDWVSLACPTHAL